MLSDSGKMIFHNNVLLLMINIDELLLIELKSSIINQELKIRKIAVVAIQVILFLYNLGIAYE